MIKVGRTRSNIRASIEDQFEILYKMINDISEHYQKELTDLEFNKNQQVIASGDDLDVQNVIRNQYDSIVEEHNSLLIESRKILFCAIFSYFESMLYGIINFYKISRGRANQVDQLISKILSEYESRYSEKIEFPDENRITLCVYYRPLRNFYMHGVLDSGKDREALIEIADKNKGLLTFFDGHIEILNSIFLYNALNLIKSFLVCIEEAYEAKCRSGL